MQAVTTESVSVPDKNQFEHIPFSQLADKLKEIQLKKDETIFYKGEKGHAMYIIVSGSVQVQKNMAVVVA